MKPRNCLALVVTSVLAIGCASAQAQDEKGADPKPAPQQPPAADRPRDELPPEVREAIRQGEEHIRAATDRAREAEKRMVEAKAAATGPDDAALKDAMRAVEETRKALDHLHDEQMKRMSAAGLVVFQHDGMRRGPGGQDGLRDDARRDLERVQGLPYVGGPRMGRMDRPREMGPGPSVEERLAQIERAVHEMREMFERHGVPQDARERGEREMRERRGDGPPPGGDRDPRRAWRADGFDGRPGEGQGPDERPDGPGRPPVPRPPRLEIGPRGPGGGPAAVRAENADGQLDAARAEMEAHMKQMHDQMEAQMRAAQTQMEELKKQLADTQTALKAAQAELETLKAKK